MPFTRSISTALLLYLVLLQHLCLGQSEILAKNYSHLYDPQAEIQLWHNIVNLEGHSKIFLKILIRHNRTKIKDLATTYAYLDRYGGELVFSKDTLPLSNFWINNIGNQHFFNFEIQNPNKRKILILRILNLITENEFYYDLRIDPDAQVLNSGSLINLPDQNLPYFRNYILSSESFQITSFKNPGKPHFLYRYTNNFPIASPPFSSNGESVSRELSIDSAFKVNSNERIQLRAPGLYFVQQDTSGVNGLALRVDKPFFPRKTTPQELIESLVYFCTNSEMSRLTSAGDPKKAFDEYWLDVVGSTEKARQIIRSYYRRVQQANMYFTQYKQGWKTDMGMIFIIFGSPDVVHRDGKKEEWIYERTIQLPRISFEFQRIESIFTPDHYILIRKRSYQQIWYKQIDLWRKGQIDI